MTCPACSDADFRERLFQSFRREQKYFPWQCQYCSVKFCSRIQATLHFTSPVTIHPDEPEGILEELVYSEEFKLNEKLLMSPFHTCSLKNPDSEKDKTSVKLPSQNDGNESFQPVLNDSSASCISVQSQSPEPSVGTESRDQDDHRNESECSEGLTLKENSDYDSADIPVISVDNGAPDESNPLPSFTPKKEVPGAHTKAGERLLRKNDRRRAALRRIKKERAALKDEPYWCRLCELKTASKLDHIREVHTHRVPIKCGFCVYTNFYIRRVRRHVERWHPTEYDPADFEKMRPGIELEETRKLELMTQCFTSKDRVARGRWRRPARKWQGEHRRPCNLCGVVVDARDRARQHAETKHLDCHLETFTPPDLLLLHCRHCPYSARIWHNLRQHHNRLHFRHSLRTEDYQPQLELRDNAITTLVEHCFR